MRYLFAALFLAVLVPWSTFAESHLGSLDSSSKVACEHPLKTTCPAVEESWIGQYTQLGGTDVITIEAADSTTGHDFIVKASNGKGFAYLDPIMYEDEDGCIVCEWALLTLEGDHSALITPTTKGFDILWDDPEFSSDTYVKR